MKEIICKTDSLVEDWQTLYEELWRHLGPCFRCKDTRRHAERYVRGLSGRMERRNGWQMAEYPGDKSPHAIQNFLGRAAWDANKVRDFLLEYAKAHLLAPDEEGVLTVDETGFLKKGEHSAGVRRQYTGTAG